MAHTENWSAAYESEPADSDSPSGGDDEFRHLKRNVRERMELEHYWKDSTTDDGKHLMGSGKGWVTNTEPTNAPSGEALDATDTGQFWFNDTDGGFFIYTGANFVPITKFDTNVNITGTLDVGGTTTVAGALTVTSNLDITGTLTVAGTTDITSALNVTGSGTFDGGIDAGSSGTVLKCKVLEIGDWNMDTTGTNDVAHGLADHEKIRSVSVLIRVDSDASPSYDITLPLGNSHPSGNALWITGINNTTIRITRGVGDYYDSNQFDETSYNRGWVTIWYEA
jgi:hypothetical protein